MTDGPAPAVMMTLDDATRALVRLAAHVAGGAEQDVRDGLREVQQAGTPAGWVEELILQSYLFSGFPRALNAAREWRRALGGQGAARESVVHGAREDDAYAIAGVATCARVYGRFYDKLRRNIVELHPELDRWMIVEGYGKVLSRPGLDLGRRELCIVAACVASGQDRQLHSHLHGSRNVGVPDGVIGESLSALGGVVDASSLERAVALWAKVRGQNGGRMTAERRNGRTADGGRRTADSGRLSATSRGC